MRSSERRALEAAEAAELAAEAFDRQDIGPTRWVADAARDECSEDALDAALTVLHAAIGWEQHPTAPERVARLRRAVAELRELFVEYAAAHGFYAADARETVDGKLADWAEASAEFRAEQRDWEANESALRG